MLSVRAAAVSLGQGHTRKEGELVRASLLRACLQSVPQRAPRQGFVASSLLRKCSPETVRCAGKQDREGEDAGQGCELRRSLRRVGRP